MKQMLNEKYQIHNLISSSSPEM